MKEGDTVIIDADHENCDHYGIDRFYEYLLRRRSHEKKQTGLFVPIFVGKYWFNWPDVAGKRKRPARLLKQF